jgi:hypothetical protein
MPILKYELVYSNDATSPEKKYLSSSVSSTTADTSDSDDGTSESTQDLCLLTCSRCPREFRIEFLEGRLMKDCIAEMQSAGQSPELATGTMLFCKPDSYGAVRQAVLPFEATLRPYHVLVTEDLRPLVLRVLKSFPRALKVRCRDEAVVARIGRAGKWAPVLAPVTPGETGHFPAAAPAATPQEVTGAVVKAEMSKDTKKATERGLPGVVPRPGLPFGTSPADQPLALDSFLQYFSNPVLQPPPEVDPVLVNSMWALQQDHTVFNEALLNTHAHLIFQADVPVLAGFRE